MALKTYANQALIEASKVLGGQSKLAAAIGVTPQTLNDWVNGRKAIPVKRCVAVEKATGGAVTRQELRPHDWQDNWPELADTRAAQSQGAQT